MKIKNILLVCKRSFFVIYSDNQKNLPKQLSLPAYEMNRIKTTHTRHYKSVEDIEQYLKDKKVKYRKVMRLQKLSYADYDLIITVGGDGTFLFAATKINKQTILGVNSDPRWSVGHFCTASWKNFPQVFDKLIAGKTKIETFNRMQLRIVGTDIRMNVLNDVLICHKNPATMSRYYITFRGIKDEQRSSGIWISTAVGSTGAIYSAGGEEMAPTSEKLQYLPRELHIGCRPKPVLRGGFISPSESIKITSRMEDGVIFVDGSRIQIPFPFGTHAVMEKSSEPLRYVAM